MEHDIITVRILAHMKHLCHTCRAIIGHPFHVGCTALFEPLYGNIFRGLFKTLLRKLYGNRPEYQSPNGLSTSSFFENKSSF